MSSPHLSRTNFEWHIFPMPKWMFFINALLLLWGVTLAKTIAPILWDKDSGNFTSSGQNITVEINDLIDINCPLVENTPDDRPNAQYHKFTQVSLQGYEHCSLNLGRVRHLLSCNRPFVQNKLTLLFQEYTPYPGGATFSHGEDYYFITTSNGTANGIDNTSGGLCATHNMKLRVHIKPKPTVPRTTQSFDPSSSTPSVTTSDHPTPTTTPTTPRPTTTMSTSTRTTTIETTTKKVSTTKKEENKLASGRGRAPQHCVSVSLLLISSLVAVVRWLHP